MKNQPRSRRKRGSQKKQKRISEVLQIPRDLSCRESVLTLCGASVLYIENYKKILEYTEERIRILGKNGDILILGEGLCICYYSAEAMKISGRIREIFPEGKKERKGG